MVNKIPRDDLTRAASPVNPSDHLMPTPIKAVPLWAVPNANERGPHEMVDLVSDNGRQRTVWGSVHVDLLDLYQADPGAYQAVRHGKAVRCQLLILEVEE